MLEAEKIATMWPTNDLIPLHEKEAGLKTRTYHFESASL